MILYKAKYVPVIPYAGVDICSGEIKPGQTIVVCEVNPSEWGFASDYKGEEHIYKYRLYDGEIEFCEKELGDKKIYKAIRKPFKLFAPKEYRELSPAAKKAYCNGCGGARTAGIVPDSILGCDIKEACNIHDFMYEFAKPTIDAKNEADRVFLNNMTRTVLNQNRGFFKFLTRSRLRLVKVYYDAVKNYGGASFWEDKNV